MFKRLLCGHDYKYQGSYLQDNRIFDDHIDKFLLYSVFRCCKCKKFKEVYMESICDLSVLPPSIYATRTELYDHILKEENKN